MILFSCICIFADNRHNKSIRFSYEVEGHSVGGLDLPIWLPNLQFELLPAAKPLSDAVVHQPQVHRQGLQSGQGQVYVMFYSRQSPFFLKIQLGMWSSNQTKPGRRHTGSIHVHCTLAPHKGSQTSCKRERKVRCHIIGNMHKLHKVNFEGTCSRSPCHWIHSRPHQLRRLDRKQLRQPGIQFVSCTYCHWVGWVMVLIRSLHLDHKSLPTWIWKWYLCDIPSYFWTTSRYKVQYMQYYITPNTNCIGSSCILSRYKVPPDTNCTDSSRIPSRQVPQQGSPLMHSKTPALLMIQGDERMRCK